MAISAIEPRELPENTLRWSGSASRSGRPSIPEWIRPTMEAVQRSGQQPAGMPFIRSFSLDGDTMDIEIGWPAAEPFRGDGDVQASKPQGGPTAVASYFGPYEEIAPAHEAIQAWCKNTITRSPALRGSPMSPTPTRNPIPRSGERTSTSR